MEEGKVAASVGFVSARAADVNVRRAEAIIAQVLELVGTGQPVERIEERVRSACHRAWSAGWHTGFTDRGEAAGPVADNPFDDPIAAALPVDSVASEYDR